ncbi:Nuclear export mediator factor NEMF [Thelohanellus kitauei]|uniref:Nuclear export mediator factor NEMF n=1 Tax=Thelohanellus kitauei TaxID=669202 RepID=A0A0C2MN96_THEKT|nr:Nuclear export mediator factor NEMF [Thelohanellus kitauei]
MQRKFKQLDSFCETVDEFYSQIENQKVEIQLLNREKTALSKVEHVKKDLEVRLDALTKEKDSCFDTAELIIENQEIVNNAIFVVNSALANEWSWTEIDNFIAEAKEENDRIASIIEYTKFDSNQIALKLSDSESNTRTVLVDLSLNAFANSKQYFQTRRMVIDKIERTLASQNKALQSAKAKMKRVVKENEVQVKIKKNRKTNWFEKFRYFISSDNYLVIAGRDAQENEYLVKRHTTKSDIFVHAEIHGSAVVIIKVQKEQINPKSQWPVPIRTLSESATFAVCFSSAWESRVVVPAYWVRMEQVSKSAPTGEYLQVGGFSIKGTKNFIPFPTMVLGLGLLFKVDPFSNFNHENDRLPKWSDENATETLEEVAQEEEPLPEVSDEAESEEPEEAFDTKLLSDVIVTKAAKVEISEDIQPKLKQKNTSSCQTEKKQNNEQVTKSEEVQTNKSQFKRGQKSKYKIQKLKYRDQDEEERELINQMIHTSVKPQTSKKKQKKLKEEEKQRKKTEIQQAKQNKQKVEKQTEIELQSEDSDSEKNNEQQFLSSFISNPLPEDELLYGIMVCAPYATLSTYKYKVKLTPGTTKRGKAIKAATAFFLNAKGSNERERLLISALKDTDHSRYIPTLVKVSAPNMLLSKNKK